MKNQPQRDASILRALKEAKGDCQHMSSNRARDLATGDEFCGDCGDLIKRYAHERGVLAGDEAAAAIAKHAGRPVNVFSTFHLGEDEFEVHTMTMAGSGDSEYWIIRRYSNGDLVVTPRAR